MSRSRVKGPAGDLAVVDQGKGGLPVVFVHSFAGNSSHWDAQLDHLKERRRAIAFDLRAHGESVPSVRGDYAVRSFAEDIGAVVDALGLERFVLVGHSLGGAAGIAYAGAHPDRVAGLLLVGAPGKMPEVQSRPIIDAMESHWVHMDRPDEFNRMLDEFLAEIDERKQSGAPDQAPAEARRC
jgi:pimeloyl-ACP methyl ester carboxylesterase